MAVERFRGKYLPFSNMYPLDAWVETDRGILVPTAEHAYMANRFVDPSVHIAIAAARAIETEERWRDALASKELAHYYIKQGKELTYQDDEEKIAIMDRVIRQKLARNAAIRALLLETGEEEIFEGNNWDDRFWGVSPIGSRNGANHLGRIYMNLRGFAPGSIG